MKLDAFCPLPVLQGLFANGSNLLSSPPHSNFPQTRSPHSQHALQELKDDLLYDTTWLVVMHWFNEDH